MEEKQVTHSIYTCSYCGKTSLEKKDCERCEETGKLLELSKNWKPFHWFELKNKQTNETEYVFVKRIYKYHNIDQKCTHAELNLYDSKYHQYYALINSYWVFVDTFDILTGWNKYKLVPEFYTDYKLNEMPDVFKEQYWKVRANFLVEEAERINKEFNKMDLINELIKHNHPNLFKNLPPEIGEIDTSKVVDPVLKLSNEQMKEIHNSVVYGVAEQNDGWTPTQKTEKDISNMVKTFFDNLPDE